MSLYRNYKTTEAATLGKPVTFRKNADGTIPTFYIAREGASNQAYMQALTKHFKLENRDEDSMLKSFIEGCVKGWENIRDENDVEIEFNFDNALKVLKDLPEVAAQLSVFAQNIENYLIENLEEVAKN